MTTHHTEPSAPDGTLQGYREIHDRPPAFTGSDGHPYTVSLEIDRSGGLRTPFEGYLVFPRWAQNGLGVVGHVESPVLTNGSSRSDVASELGALSLSRVKELLEEAILASASPEKGLSRG